MTQWNDGPTAVAREVWETLNLAERTGTVHAVVYMDGHGTVREVEEFDPQEREMADILDHLHTRAMGLGLLQLGATITSTDPKEFAHVLFVVRHGDYDEEPCAADREAIEVLTLLVLGKDVPLTIEGFLGIGRSLDELGYAEPMLKRLAKRMRDETGDPVAWRKAKAAEGRRLYDSAVAGSDDPERTRRNLASTLEVAAYLERGEEPPRELVERGKADVDREIAASRGEPAPQPSRKPVPSIFDVPAIDLVGEPFSEDKPRLN